MNSNLENFPDLSSIERKLDRLVGVLVVLLGALLFLLALGCLQIAWAIPRFARIFTEMLGDKPLPAMTQLVIGLGHLGYGMMLPACSVLLPLAAVVFLVIRRQDSKAWMVAAATVVVLVLWIVMAVAALYLPMIAIITEMN